MNDAMSWPLGRCRGVMLSATGEGLVLSLWVLLALGLLTPGCRLSGDLPGGERPTSLRVRFTGDPSTGCEPGEELLPFAPNHDVIYGLEIEALGVDGSRFPYTGILTLDALPGQVRTLSREVQMNNGLLQMDVRFRLSHGPTVFWVRATDPHGYLASGVSPKLCFQYPRIEDIRRSDNPHRSPLQNEEVLVKEGVLMVTGTNSMGFYLSDLSQPVFGAIYVFTFSNPLGVYPGARLCWLGGGVKPFLGMTQLSFPSYSVYGVPYDERDTEDEIPDPRQHYGPQVQLCDLEMPHLQGEAHLPDPVVIDPNDIPARDEWRYVDHLRMDRYESNLVQVVDARIPNLFTDCDYDGSGTVDRCFEDGCWEGLDPAAPDFCSQVETHPACNLGDGRTCSCNTVRETICFYACIDNRNCSELSGLMTYGQWTATLPGGRRITVNTGNLPDFDPRDHAGTTLKSIIGHLNQINSAVPNWSIEPRWPEDLAWD